MSKKTRTIYTYKKHEFNSYRVFLESQNIKLCSISEFLKEEIIDEVNESEEPYIIDFSTMAELTKNDNSIVFQFEQLIPKFKNNIKFIIENKYAEEFIYNFRYCFTEYEELNIELFDEDILKTESKIDQQSVKKITDLSQDDLDTFFYYFENKLYGHKRFKDEFQKIINTFIVFNKIGEHKILSLFLMGDSGIGKTEVARVIHKCLGSNKKLAKISFGNYSSKDSLNSLIGSPLGYIGSDGGELIKRVKESDIGLILIDEFEKADTAVFNYFLDVLENGIITNTQSEEYDIDGYIIVFTSNVTKERFEKELSPELRSRFDYKGVFDLLTNEDKKKFLYFRVNEIIKKYNDRSGYTFNEDLKNSLYKSIDVSQYKNMRELNKKIKDEFVKCVNLST